MKKYGKIFIVSVMLLLSAVSPAFSQTGTLDALQTGVNTFSADIAKSLPFNSTIGLNWSNAYIGQLIGIPPKFGVGLSLGATVFDLKSINSLMGLFDASPIDIAVGIPLPAYTVEGRVGGIFLPFDVGFKIGVLPEIPFLSSFGVGLDYFLVGADIRYSLLPKEIPIVKLSVGLGFNHLSGGISKSIKTSQSFKFAEDYSVNIGDSDIGLRWKTNVLELKTQASFNFLIITPYIGLGLSYGWSEAGYAINAPVTMTGPGGIPITEDQYANTLKNNGISGINIRKNGIESMIPNGAINARIFGGTSLNLAMVKFDFTGMYNFTSSDWGLTFGIRFQL